jgi:hypothetical protein
VHACSTCIVVHGEGCEKALVHCMLAPTAVAVCSATSTSSSLCQNTPKEARVVAVGRSFVFVASWSCYTAARCLTQ